jgi:hypothetical protein
VDTTGSGWSQVADCREHGSAEGEFIDQLPGYHLFKISVQSSSKIIQYKSLKF